MKHKNLLFTFAVAILLLFSAQCIGQPAEQKVLVTLQSNEEILYYESCIPMSFTDGNLYLVTRQDNQIYVYDNGVRKGPFKDTKSANIRNCGATNNSTSCSIWKGEEADQGKFMSFGSDGNVKINYNGKSIGDFQQISQMISAANGNKIALYGMNAKFEPLFMTPAGNVIPLAGEPQQIVISPSGNLAIVTMKGSENLKIPTPEEVAQKAQQMQDEFNSVDFSKMTPEEMQAFSQKIQEKYGTGQTEDNNPDYYFWLSDGKKLGPFKLGGSAGQNPSFCTTGGDNWYFIADEKLYINGLMIKDFTEYAPSLCQVWISTDGKRYAAYMGYEKLAFSDGQTYQSPMQIKSDLQNGKAYLTWLSLDTKNQLILFKKAL
jgi:hypothetical protein